MQTHGASLRRRVSNGIAMVDRFVMLLLRIGEALYPMDPAQSSLVVTCYGPAQARCPEGMEICSINSGE